MSSREQMEGYSRLISLTDEESVRDEFWLWGRAEPASDCQR